MGEPSHDPVQDHSGPVHNREFVIPGRKSPPLLQPTIPTLNDVTAPILHPVKLRWPATPGTTPLAMPLLIAGLRNHCLDPAASQVLPVRT